MSNVITDAMNIATENQHKVDNLYGVLNNYKLSKKNKGYENDHSNKSLKDIRRLLTTDKSDDIEFTTTPMKSAKSWSAICYGNGKFVAVSKWDSNVVTYSFDGITWLESTLPASKYWIDVCYGNGKFVAIAGNEQTNYSAISSDGITWKAVTLPETKSWKSVCYGNNSFVIVGAGDKVLVGDGETYQAYDMPADQTYMAVCYNGSNKFVAITYTTYYTGYFAYSTNGSSWTLVSTAAFRQDWNRLCYGGAKFVAVATGSGSGGSPVYAYSYDGIAWTESRLPIKAGCRYYDIDYGRFNGKDMFIVTESNNGGNGAFHYSYYGFEWESGILPSSSDRFIDYPICYGNGKFVITPENSSVALYSEVVTDVNMFEVADITSEAEPTDLVFGAKTPVVYKEELGDFEATYNTIPGSATSTTVYAACYGNGTIVVLPQTKAGSTMNKVYYSTDEGTTWTQNTLPTYQSWESVCYGNGKFVAVAYYSNYFIYSSDGITWNRVMPMNSPNSWCSICYGNDKFVAVAQDSDTFVYSLNGTTWSQGTLPASEEWHSVCYGNDKFVAIASVTNAFIYSSNGITWTEGTMPSSNDWYSICYGKDKFVAIIGRGTYSKTFAYSSDGITWTQGTLPTSEEWHSVCYGKDKFIAISSSDFAYSSDGISWVLGKKNYLSTKSYNFEHSGVVVPTASGFMLFGVSDSEIQYWKINKTEKPLGFKESNLPLGGHNDYQAICFGNNQFITQNYSSNIIYYSSDGITWTAGSAVNYSWYSVCYGNGKYVAISNAGSGSSNTTMYSTDGITWTMGSIAYTSSGVGHYRIYYCNNKFFALARDTDNEYAYSNDGITWTAGQFNSKMYQTNIAFGNDIYVVVGNLDQDDDYETVSEYSVDGINWSMSNLSFGGSDVSSRGLAFGNGVFVLPIGIANSYASKYYYSDGVNWEEREFPTWYRCDAFAFGENKFVLIPSSGRYFYSTDGINWRNEPLDHDNTHGEICYGNGTFVLTPWYSNTPAYYSYELTPYNNYAYQESALPADIGLSRNAVLNDGRFKQSQLSSELKIKAVSYGNGIFIAVDTSKVYYSSDGIIWTQGFIYTVSANTTVHTPSICYNTIRKIFYLYNFNSGVFTTPNGINFEYIEVIDHIYETTMVVWFKDKYLRIFNYNDSGAQEVQYSTNGTVWTTVTTVDGSYNMISRNICAGENGCIILYDYSMPAAELAPLTEAVYSTDGIAWESLNIYPGSLGESSGKNFDIWYAHNKFFIGCAGSCDDDGGAPMDFYQFPAVYYMCYGNGKYVGLLNSNQYTYSTDGITWINGPIHNFSITPFLDKNSYIRNTDYCMCYGNDNFIIFPTENRSQILFGTLNIGTEPSPTYELVSTDLSIKDIMNSYGSSTGNYLYSSTSVETIDSNDYLDSINVYTIDPITYETSKVPSWDLCKMIVGDNTRPIISKYEKIYAIKPLKNAMHKFYGWVYVNTYEVYSYLICTKDFINYYTLSLIDGPDFVSFTDGIDVKTDVSTITDDQFTKVVQKYLSILPDNTIVYMNPSDLYSGIDTNMCYIIDPFSNTQEVKSANNRTTFMTIKDDYGTGDYRNKAIAGISAYLNDNGEIVVHYNNRSEIPLTIYNGRVMNNTPYSTKYSNYGKEVIASPKVAKLFGSATVDSTNNMSTFKASIDTMSMDLAITTVDGKDNTKNASESYLPAASVSLAIGDVSDRIYDNEDERFKHFNKVALFVNEAIENMDNIDIDFSEYMETTAIDRDSVVKDGKNDKEYDKEYKGFVKGNLPSEQNWYSVCYGKDKFVAVASHTDIFAYSLDGITWTQGNLPVSDLWKSVCYGKDKFVTVANSSNVFAYSLDGITWTQGNLPVSDFWIDVCYGKDKFVAVAYYSSIFAYSLDGITWTQGNLPSEQDWLSVCYGKDKFVTVASDTDIFAYSLDGITWTQGNLPASKYWIDVCYGKDKFVAVGYNSNVFAYSLDGITWTQGNLPVSKDWRSVCYDKDKFVTVASSSNIFAYSLDGITWTEDTMSSIENWQSVCYGKDKFVTVAYSSNIFAYIPVVSDPKFITSKIYNSNTLEINNRSENTDSNLRYRATVIGNTLLTDKFHMNNPRFTK